MSEADNDANALESLEVNERSRAGEANSSRAAVLRPRRPYLAPTLRHLGCVRDLTLGGASGFAEGAGTFVRPPMM